MAFIVGEFSSLCGWFCAKGRRVRGSLGRGDCVQESRGLYGCFSCFGGGRETRKTNGLRVLCLQTSPALSLRKVLVSLGFPGFGLIVFVGWRD